MDKKQLEDQAKRYFKLDKNRKAIYATESGHFFYEKDTRQKFMVKSPNEEKPVDFFRDKLAKKEAGEKGLPEDCPGLKILISKGFKSIAELKACKDLTAVPGIGKAKAEEIKEFLKDFE